MFSNTSHLSHFRDYKLSWYYYQISVRITEVHLFNSVLYSTWWSIILNSGLLSRGDTFLTHFGFLIFPFAFRLILFRELTRTFAKTNKTRPIELDRVSFYIRCTVINSLRELITKVMWFSDRHKIQDNIYRAK